MLRLGVFLFAVVGLVMMPFPQDFVEIQHHPITVANAAHAQPLMTLTTGYIQYIALSPDEQTLAVAFALEIHFYDMQANDPFSTQRSIITSTHGTIYRVAFHPDSERVAISYLDGVVEVWQWQNNILELTLEGHLLPVMGLAFSPDGQYLATGSGALNQDDIHPFIRTNTVRIWDVSTGNTVTWWGEIEARDLAFTTDSSALYVLSTRDFVPGWRRLNSYALRRLDISSHATEVLFPKAVDERLDDMLIYQLSLSSDNRWLVLPQISAQTPIWDVSAHEELLLLPPASHVKSTAFSRNNQFMAMGKLKNGSNSHTLSVWDTATWHMTINFPTTDNMHQVLLDERGTKLISLQSNPTSFWNTPRQQLLRLTNYRTVHIWDVATQQEIATLKPAQLDVSAIQFHPDFANLLVVAEWNGDARGRINLWDIEEQTILQAWQDMGVIDVAFHPTLPHIATIQVDNGIFIRNFVNGETVWQKKLPQPKFTNVLFHPSGEGLVTYGEKGVLWNLTTDESREINTWQTNSVRFSQDGESILFGNALAVVVSFNLDEDIVTRGVLDYFTDNGPHIWELSAEGQFIIGADNNFGFNGKLVMWDVGEPGRPTYSLSFRGEITSMALHPDNTLLGLATTDGQLHLVDLTTKRVVATQQNQTGQYTHLAFNADGSRLATVDNNGVIQVWGMTKP